MKSLRVFFFLLGLLLSLSQVGVCFEVKDIKIAFFEKQPLVTIFFKDFPFQELVLSLKSQKNPIYINYTFEIYRKRPILRDVLLHKEIYVQKLYYNPEENLYFLEDNFFVRTFDKPEEALLKTFYLDSYPLRFMVENAKEQDLYLKIVVNIGYVTHLSKDLKFTKKERKVALKAEKSVFLKK